MKPQPSTASMPSPLLSHQPTAVPAAAAEDYFLRAVRVRHALQLPPFCPMATKGQWAGCNPVSKNWDTCKVPPAAANRTWAYPPPWTGHQTRR